MADLTLPLKGGWILCTKVPPTSIKPAFLGIYFAKPEKVFERGSFQWLGAGSGLQDGELAILYRHRQRAKLTADQHSALVRIERRLSGQVFQWEREPISLFDDSTDEELAEADNIPAKPMPALDEIELEMRVRIVTPNGELCLEPHEYSIIADIEPYMETIGAEYEMRELGGIKNAKKLNEQVFYVMSRGVPRTEAYKILLGQIERPNVFWLEPHIELQRMFDRSAA